ncbi:hypothetical protein PFISCL1PPCAC_28381 [Pristionchus fissidentatus]|uniref:Uncharacterized protein n=1 Tax=Pristionchus fissidentatus TaxID=1538716 RepID=A0AAV5VLY4_9BILA|nr:hypothetical protein PFISCL1PPCAC_11851 [Pristionchus fissidentatus]GMT37084.1 hypothetical protein PFISCL1PPCAC_28381 [Pristionchus fissidentatus]
MSGRLSLADLRRRRALAGTEDDNTPLLHTPTATKSTAAAAATPPGQAATPPPPAKASSKSLIDRIDDILDSAAVFPVNYKDDEQRKETIGRAYGTKWFESLTTEEREDLHEQSIVRMHSLMNPNRRAAKYYVTPEGKRKKTLECDYLNERSGILQAIRRSGEARVYGWYALYFLFARLWMCTFILLADIIMDPTDALFECLWGGEHQQCGPQREGATYALWVYIGNAIVGWLVCVICTHIFPQYDERFNIFHIRITQRAMLFLLLLSCLTLAFEYFTYGGSSLRRLFEFINIFLSIAVYILCVLSTWITAHETAAVAEAIKNQEEHYKRYKMMAADGRKLRKAARELEEQKKESEAVWAPPVQAALPVSSPAKAP